MKQNIFVGKLLLIAVMVLITLIVSSGVRANPRFGLPDGEGVVGYQGRIMVKGEPYSGTGHFKFALVSEDGSVTYWSNDGSSTAGSEPAASIALPVTESHFSVMLGDTRLPGMTIPISVDTFRYSDCLLRVWFGIDGASFQQLSPDQQIGTVPYAFEAMHASSADSSVQADLAAQADNAALLNGMQPAELEMMDGIGQMYLVRQWPSQIAKIESGENEQAVIAVIGDSWIQLPSIVKNIRDWTQERYGDAGVGYVSLSLPAPVGASLSRSGTWTDVINDPNSKGPNLRHAISFDTATPAGAILITQSDRIVLHYFKRPGGGSFEYQVDGGNWIPVDTNFPESYALLEIGPLTLAAHTVQLRLTSAGDSGVTIMGFDCHKSRPGARVHNLGSGMSRSQDWAEVNSDHWVAGIAALNPDTVVILLGVTEFFFSGAEVDSYQTTLINRIRQASPLTDVILISPPDVGATHAPDPNATLNYSEQMRRTAYKNKTGYINGFLLFGPFEQSDARGLFDHTLNHFTPAGQRVLTDLITHNILEVSP